MIDFSAQQFHPVVLLPEDYDVLDLSVPPDQSPPRHSQFSIGRYNEQRPGTYTTDLFEEGRDIHIGVDIGAPAGTAVHAFCDGWIECFGYNAGDGDYGNTLVSGHRIDGIEIFALYGHLDSASITDKMHGQEIRAGMVIGWLGAEHENGGWPPHVHFQLAWKRPGRPDLPGVVSKDNLAQALQDYPDPLLVLGPLY